MDSQDANSSADICNGSLGREIMQAVKRNDPLRNGKKVNIFLFVLRNPKVLQIFQFKVTLQQQYDSSTASEISDVLGDIDECLDEALDEEDEMDEQHINKIVSSHFILQLFGSSNYYFFNFLENWNHKLRQFLL